MRRVYIVIAIFVFLFGAASNVYPQNSQQSDFDRANADYLFNLDVYEREHSDYLLAKAQYQQAGTLASETNAISATKTMLEARDDVVVSFLTALRIKLADSPGIGNSEKEGFYNRIDAEISWFKEHRGNIQSAGTLGDLVVDSNEAADQFDKFSSATIYEVLARIPIGTLSSLRTELNQNLFTAKTKTAEIRVNGDHDTTTIERWIGEVENKITRSLDKEIEALETSQLLQNFGKKDSGRKKTYDTVVGLSDESLQFMREANGNMREIVRSMRTAN